jgi:hypothetical protein
VIESLAKRLSNLGPLSLAGACAWLSVAVLAFYVPLAVFAYSRSGSAGVWAATVAAGVCWFAATLALTLAARSSGPNRALFAVLGGMVFRFGLPFGVGLFLSQRGGPLAEAGVFGLIVACYLWTLPIETLLSVRVIQPAASGHKVS